MQHSMLRWLSSLALFLCMVIFLAGVSHSREVVGMETGVAISTNGNIGDFDPGIEVYLGLTCDDEQCNQACMAQGHFGGACDGPYQCECFEC